MTRKQQNAIATALGIVVVAGLFYKIASASPNCDRGCQNNLRHFFDHVLNDAVKGLFAASL